MNLCLSDGLRGDVVSGKENKLMRQKPSFGREREQSE